MNIASLKRSGNLKKTVVFEVSSATNCTEAKGLFLGLQSGVLYRYDPVDDSLYHNDTLMSQGLGIPFLYLLSEDNLSTMFSDRKDGYYVVEKSNGAVIRSFDADHTLYNIWSRIGSSSYLVSYQGLPFGSGRNLLMKVEEPFGRIEWSFEHPVRTECPVVTDMQHVYMFACEEGLLYQIDAETGESETFLDVFSLAPELKPQNKTDFFSVDHACYIFDGILIFYTKGAASIIAIDLQDKSIKWKINTEYRTHRGFAVSEDGIVFYSQDKHLIEMEAGSANQISSMPLKNKWLADGEEISFHSIDLITTTHVWITRNMGSLFEAYNRKTGECIFQKKLPGLPNPPILDGNKILIQTIGGSVENYGRRDFVIS